MAKEYLGDSVYADVDEYGALILTTENGLPEDPSNRIVIEPPVYQAMMSFVRRHNENTP